MSEADEVKVENTDAEKTSPITRGQKILEARRKFLRQALAATTGLAIVGGWKYPLTSSASEAASQGPGCATGPDFIPVEEIGQVGGRLRAVIKVTNGNRTVPGKSNPLMLRYYAGYTPDNLTKPVWPTSNNAGPGPTLRCEVGNSVEITFVNNVNVAQFSGSLYSGEKGTGSGCDEVNAGRWYPANDKFPNCFHASSAANMHFHGSHVSPSTTADNVLVNVQPNSSMTDADIKQIQEWFKPIFDKGEAVAKYNDLPSDWKNSQMGPWKNYPKGLIGQYDANAPYKGKRGLPPDLQLWPKNKAVIDATEWPQYYVGSYPICFRIPKYMGPNGPVKMGQAPGTHWYHSHKHGSTSVNLFNGLSGAFIIEDNSPNRTAYDYVLRTFYENQGQKLDQVVLVFQQITDTIPLLTGAAAGFPGAPPMYVNGQQAPVLEMKPGQIQLWRMINATVAAFLTNVDFAACIAGNPTLQCKQTAQDGVQFHPDNYFSQPLGNQGTNPIGDKMAPGNRIDLLVQAPMAEGMHVMQIAGQPPTPILYINVKGTALSSQMKFPDKADFPAMPEFLNDILSTDGTPREYIYGSLPPPPTNITSATTGNTRTLKQWSINGKQFSEGNVDKPIQLGNAEEWKISNADGPAHPFHIHINPFQIVEVFDPDKMTQPLVLKPPYIWWDAFAIPPAKNGVNGYFKLRSKFVDFTGVYVQHCHILAHEDRGMMLLVEVCADVNKNCGKQKNVSHH